MRHKDIEFKDLVGTTITEVKEYGDDRLEFITNKGNYAMYHSQDCCENVSIDDINGDLNDLLNTPVLDAYESTNRENQKEDYDESFTWTFYHISTIKGTVSIKWYGTSNGYYSEGVDFVKLTNND